MNQKVDYLTECPYLVAPLLDRITHQARHYALEAGRTITDIATIDWDEIIMAMHGDTIHAYSKRIDQLEQADGLDPDILETLLCEVDDYVGEIAIEACHYPAEGDQ